MINLPQVTVVAVTTKDYGLTITAINKTLQQIKPARTIYFSDVPHMSGEFEHILIPAFKSVEDYNYFIFKQLGQYISTSHVLVIQHDGFVINGSAWSDEFLQYDYVGAPWTYTDGRNVGNGGFSLRSSRLHTILASDPEFEYYSPEDEKICRYYRQTLEKKYKIKFAPEHVAHKFSYELHAPKCKTFGFHNNFHPPYREPIILKRSGAMGDIIMMEPVMEYFFNKGYRVILDTQPRYWNLFAKHFYHIELLQMVQQREDMSMARVINLDMSYENEPQELVLKTFYKYCNIPDGEPKNSKLNFKPTPEVKLFDKYVILHTDDTAMAHRNIHGVEWEEVATYIQVFLGYPVFRVGIGNGKGGTKIQTYSENMLAYIISGADYFIGIDSGCAQISVACQVRSMIFFGSVNPKLRYDSFERITVMQNACPIAKDGCYHTVQTEIGQECEVDAKTPPCISWKTKDVIEQVKKFIV